MKRVVSTPNARKDLSKMLKEINGSPQRASTESLPRKARSSPRRELPSKLSAITNP
jgi:hypothetical protein